MLSNLSAGVFIQIDPDVDEDQTKNPERKKLKLKEVHLTKLLSTKARGTSYSATVCLNKQPLIQNWYQNLSHKVIHNHVRHGYMVNLATFSNLPF